MPLPQLEASQDSSGAILNPLVVNWYEEHMDCQTITGRDNAVSCGTAEIEFLLGATVGGSQGTGVDHIGFSVTDLDAKMNELENVGVQGSGVRLLRFDDGSLVRDIPGLDQCVVDTCQVLRNVDALVKRAVDAHAVGGADPAPPRLQNKTSRAAHT